MKMLPGHSGMVRLLLFGLLTVVGTTLLAQDENTLNTRTFVYSAKFVCKNAGPPVTDAGRAFMPAVYRTVINVHNLHAEPIRIKIRAVEAHSIKNPVPGASGRVEKRLAPGQAVFVSCGAIQEILGDAPEAQNKVDGFVTIASPRRLDAAVVYSAVTRTPLEPNDGVTIDVERLRPKIVWVDGRVDEE